MNVLRINIMIFHSKIIKYWRVYKSGIECHQSYYMITIHHYYIMNNPVITIILLSTAINLKHYYS